MTKKFNAMKQSISIVLAVLLLIAFGLTAMAEDAASDESGFSIEELPAFGEENEVVFLPDESPEANPTAELSAEPELTSENEKAQDENSNENHSPQEEPAAESRAEEGESETIASSPAPENETISSKQNNYPVIIIAAVLAACAILFVIVNKRKPTKRRNG